MLDELTEELFMEILSEYKIVYELIPTKGRIRYRNKEIVINPAFNEDYLTIVHEVGHHFYDVIKSVPMDEEIIEELAIEYLAQNDWVREIDLSKYVR